MSELDALLAHAVDRARWTETRAMALSGRCHILGSRAAGGWIVVSDHAPLAGVVGQPNRAVFDEAAAAMPEDVELLVAPDDLDHVKRMLPAWRVVPALLHEIPNNWAPPGQIAQPSDVILFERVDDFVIRQFPAEMQDDVRRATIVAAKRVDGQFVSMCGTEAITETRWDVSIDTPEAYRRRGHARDCFLTLDAALRRRGRQPVWGATLDNAASLGMAKSLGFVPVDEISILLRS